MKLTIKLGVDGNLFMMYAAMKRIIYHIFRIIKYFYGLLLALNDHLFGKTNYIAVVNTSA